MIIFDVMKKRISLDKVSSLKLIKITEYIIIITNKKLLYDGGNVIIVR